jgi:rRNA-processing protein CGR1
MPGLQSRAIKKTGELSKPKRALNTKKEGSSWTVKMNLKKKMDGIKTLAKNLRDEINAESQQARDSRRANKVRHEENERKNMVVQEIKNVRAIKKLTSKQKRRARICLQHEL